MQLATYFDILRRRLLIFLVIPAVLAALALAYTESKTPIYESQATLLVRNLAPVPGSTLPTEPTPAPAELNDLLTNDRIMATYTELANRRVVRQSVIDALGLPYTEAQIAAKVSVEHLRNTQLLAITARDTDAELASSLANQTAEVFIAQSDVEFGEAGTVAIVEEAVPGTTPVSPDSQQAVLLAIVVGVLIAGIIVLFLEHADDTLKTPQDVSAVSGLPTLAVIGRARHPDRLRAGDVLLEDYRDLRSTVTSQREHYGLHAILIAGHGRDEGRTTTALNLSITLAELGESVILVDADLREPNLHKITGTPNEAGVSDLLQREYNPADWPLYRVNKAFELLPAGPPPSSPSVVSSASMEELLRQLRASADIVILDSPALSAVADGFDLARVVDGTILVVEAGRTRGEELQLIASTLDERGARVLGVVLNKGESPRRKHPR
ncbi:MAG TPA: Wzz/FepE/Etk N-terminal domain-containing protein, partial [Dehalococcoidia bacterium]|nr:Wzz/FepE/Etk N-terminal domain-containing protein [Dehalococcoidia bacterium]